MLCDDSQPDHVGGGSAAGHAFIQNLRRDHYKLGLVKLPARHAVSAASELIPAI